MIDIINHINSNSYPLFKNCELNINNAIFDQKGFWFSEQAQIEYDILKNKPHLYIAYTKSNNGVYIGKSFQKGGRWKRSHAYHLGTLAYHLLDLIRYDDQIHSHWIESWMNVNNLNKIEPPFYIELKEDVFISFIPFDKYSNKCFTELSKQEIRSINHRMETELIKYYKAVGVKLLNIKNN